MPAKIQGGSSAKLISGKESRYWERCPEIDLDQAIDSTLYRKNGFCGLHPKTPRI